MRSAPRCAFLTPMSEPHTHTNRQILLSLASVPKMAFSMKKDAAEETGDCVEGFMENDLPVEQMRNPLMSESGWMLSPIVETSQIKE